MHVPFPEHLVGADNEDWLELVIYLYTDHPDTIMSDRWDATHHLKEGAVCRFRDE